MLKQLEAKCFRRHKDLTVQFSEGLHTIRGTNEAGKSTIIEAILYAFFGSRVLRTTFEDTVTWGHPPGDLKVTLHFGDYVWTRSSRGAEVTQGDKVLVTGQNEVSLFSSSVLGADAGLASKLMLANQGNLRGSLEAGPKAVTEQIESLADFDLFDRLIEVMQEKLLLGNPGVLESQLKQRRDTLAAYQMPEPPDETRHLAILNDLENEKAVAEAALEQSQDAETLASIAYDKVRDSAAEYRTLVEKAAQAVTIVERHTAELEAARKQVKDEGGLLAAIKALAKALDLAKDADKALAAKKVFDGYKIPADAPIWDGDMGSLNAAMRESQEVIESAQAHVADMKRTIRELRASIIKSDSCPTCGQKLLNAEAIAADNRRHEDAARVLEEKLPEVEGKLAEAQKTLATLRAVESLGVKASTVILKTSNYISADHSTVPPKLTWIAPIPQDIISVTDMQGEIAGLEASLQESRRAQARVDTLKAMLAEEIDARDAIASLVQTVSPVTQDDVDRAFSARAQAHAVTSAADLNLTAVQGRIVLENQMFKQAADDYARAQAALENLREEVVLAEEQLEKLHFNNTLLKKVRAARPIIADKLWNTVLAAVSQMFSMMRGEKSVVSKSKDGFSVNGQHVAALSGSTLDLLGLAIRVALVRTFLPTCPFIILDEPAAAMDTDRTIQMLGFIATCGFNQIVLVTHEDVSETFSDHLIQL